ncbi:malto-oligosyltrehalose synthase [Mucilaginibacter achroorhodeus]|uniref:4-alpha-glucanotransferase n=1 Tax=Mucilaginibacter achroorhodeus TaxID=2599294 RepID=A0A563U3T9_9SPHI|nr:malto-oligosyltrehalose synthase [Mucilaginibacter achroorhodeus]TWR26001.1 malto-oligosyltrehalose synthase [Mucilaginibacter achroorhodeus]
MFDPIATYRIQFHKDFTFKNLEAIIPYLSDLGIKTLYASPIFNAVPGSNHGYDGTDPLSINPEIGTLEELREISFKLKEAGISWLQDIVPNHMAFHHNNKWLMDVLKNGPQSKYKDYFDQGLADGAFFKGPIMVPFLGDDLQNVIDNGDLSVVYENEEFFLAYADQRWPLNDAATTGLQKADLASINKNKILLVELASQQYYRLCSWKETDNRINFRRFFTVNSLICLNIQKQEVFDHFHQFIVQLINEGVIQGLRIDHIDGLYDPEQYTERLRQLVGDDVYIVAEKILEQSEKLPQWPIQGTSGYDFLAQVNNLFTDKKAEKAFNKHYQKLIGDSIAVENQILDKKRLILTTYMNGELDNLINYYFELGLGDRSNFANVKNSIADLLIDLPVYRFYGNKWPLNDDEQDKLASVLKDQISLFESDINENLLVFYQRCMQFSGPLMAKGVEDTLMYTYNRFIAHNEVGDAPDAFGVTADQFHQLMQARQQQWPLALNGTSTHDTKRGEDARARLNVLSHLGDEWFDKVNKWREINAGLRQGDAPDTNDEYFIYQTLIGTYAGGTEDLQTYKKRLSAYLEKVLREAKVHSNWASPNEDYEKATKAFALNLLDDTKPFWKSFEAFYKKVAQYGAINSYAQVALKLTCPGVPDIYQGCELWDLSMVDPDNRRPVDYELRQNLLQEGFGAKAWIQSDGSFKLHLLQKLLKLRSSIGNFSNGNYLPLQVKGKHANDVIAFARVFKDEWIITIAPLTLTNVAENGIDKYDAKHWANTVVLLPNEAPPRCSDAITGKEISLKAEIKLKKILVDLPLTVLNLKPSDSARSAGVLLHITSLPSAFGNGDFGSNAFAFANQLKAANQRYWQILPLNAVSETDAFSPYSGTSSQAGNLLLISPELLVKDGLLNDSELQKFKIIPGSKVDFIAAESARFQLLELAWKHFNTSVENKTAFAEFCKKEEWWLNDFALYSLLKEINDDAPWQQWDNKFKLRDSKTLNKLSVEHEERLAELKWYQFIFTTQWYQLKAYCNNLGIKIFGDLPFYISHDSADVWANPGLFDLDEDLNMASICGVPPDYFNEEGQLWGMPTFNWQNLKKTGYNWWIKRIAKNLEWYDLLRLDHFRAFSAYWSVPAGEQTAINGTWMKGPGSDFFEELKKAFPATPFVAEDLGEIDKPVYELKDRYHLPGMKVLQFAFGDNIASSPHISHQHKPTDVVYTGTHDNNTTLGWFNEDADKTSMKNLKRYTGIKPKESNITNVLIKEALSSVCDLAIIPIQDWLDLDENARMNTPASQSENWTWQLTKEQLNALPLNRMRKWTMFFGRI